MPFARHGDMEIWYSDQGVGPTVLLLHGGLFEPMDGERFWVQPGVVGGLVSAGYRVLVPDRRYSGGRTKAPYVVHSWELDVADMAAVLRSAGVERAHIVGASNSCSTALRLGLSEPGLVESLLLCWPLAPGRDDLQRLFTLSADLIESIGPAAYLAYLREQGFLRPGEERAGFPFGIALLRDERAAGSFQALSQEEAARRMRLTARELLKGDILRGIASTEIKGLAGLRLAVLPTEPDNPIHPRALATELGLLLPAAQLLAGYPEVPRSTFPPRLSAFCATLSSFFNAQHN